MPKDRQTLLNKLRTELAFIEGGGYRNSENGPARLESSVVTWLKTTIDQLEREGNEAEANGQIPIVHVKAKFVGLN
jgi:hypothetical protein